MRRGTTPTHIFETDTDLTAAEVIYLTYRQDNENLLELTGDRIDVYADRIEVTLTQEETLAFKPNKTVYIQIRARYADDSAIASNIIETTSQVILKDEVI